MKHIIVFLSATFIFGGSTMAKDPGGVYFKNISDGDTIKAEQLVQFGLRGMKVKPAGKIVKGTGHHHLIINGSFLKKGQVVPSDKTHMHFGKGQLETSLKLKPGKYRLTLQFADGAHRSYGDQWSQTIQVTVKE